MDLGVPEKRKATEGEWGRSGGGVGEEQGRGGRATAKEGAGGAEVGAPEKSCYQKRQLQTLGKALARPYEESRALWECGGTFWGFHKGEIDVGSDREGPPHSRAEYH